MRRSRLTNTEFKSLHGTARGEFELYFCIFDEKGKMVSRDDCGVFTLQKAKDYVLSKKDYLATLPKYEIGCLVPDDDSEFKANEVSKRLAALVK